MAVFSSTHDYSLHPRLLLRHSTGACALRGIHSLEGMHSPVTPASIELKFAGGILGIIDIPAMGLTQGGTPCPPCLFYLCRLCFGTGDLPHIL